MTVKGISRETANRIIDVWGVAENENVVKMHCDPEELTKICLDENLPVSLALSAVIQQFDLVSECEESEKWLVSMDRAHQITNFVSYAVKKMGSITGNESGVERPYPLSLHHQGVSEFFTFGREDGTNIMLYYVYKSRSLDIPSTKSTKWLARLANKKKRKGEGFKEYFLLEAYEFFRSLEVLPLCIDTLEDMLDIDKNPFVAYVEDKLESDLANAPASIREAARKIRAIRVFSWFRAFELSDTPTWVSLSYDLCLLLLSTETSGVLADDIQLPMPLMNFELSPDVFTVMDAKGKIEYVNMISMLKHNTLQKGLTNKEVLSMIVYLSGDDTCGWIASTSSFELEVGGGIGQGISSRVMVEDGARFFILDKEVPEDEWKDCINNLCINTILYMNSKDADVTPPSKVRLERRNKKKSKGNTLLGEYEQIVVGTSVKLDKRTRDVLRGNYSGRKITYAFTVRGHWGNRACGKGRVDRRRVWIKPYVKGRDLAKKIVSHTYEVPDPD